MITLVRSSNHVNQLGKVGHTERPFVESKEECIILSLLSLIESSKKLDSSKIIVAGSGYSERLKNFIHKNNIEFIEADRGDTESIIFCLKYIKELVNENYSGNIYLTEDDYYYHEDFLSFSEKVLNRGVQELNEYKQLAVTPFAPFGRFFQNDIFSLYYCSFVNFAMNNKLWQKHIDDMITNASNLFLESHMRTLWAQENNTQSDSSIGLVSTPFYGAAHLQQPDFENFKQFVKIDETLLNKIKIS
jgi:hypothetical protein